MASTSIDSRTTTTVLSVCAIMGLSHILASRPINLFLAATIQNIYSDGKEIFERTLYNSPVIALSGLVGFGTNLALNQFATNLSPAIGIQGSLKVAYFVAGTFFLNTALSLELERAIAKNREEDVGTKEVSRIQNTVVRYLVPLTISTIAARSYGLEVKTLPAVVLTMSILYGMKLLGACYQRVIRKEQVNNWLVKVYAVVNLPKPETQPKQ